MKRQQIEKLKGQIEELKEEAKTTNELEEDRQLKKFEAEYDELSRMYDDKLEKIAISRNQQKDLEEKLKKA